MATLGAETTSTYVSSGCGLRLIIYLTCAFLLHCGEGEFLWHRVTEGWLMGEMTCPICGGTDIGVVSLAVW